MSNQNWKLSPSDFAFLWEDCKRCFYLKVVKNFPPPRSIMAKIFTIIDNEMRTYFDGKRLETIVPGFQPGVVGHGEKWVQSKPISFPDEKSTCFVKGKLDTIVKFDDGTYGVIDFKTSQRKAEHIALYARQLHAYAHALENPAPGQFSVGPISKLGLLVYEPTKFSADSLESALLSGGLAWLEIPRDDNMFFDFLKEVMSVLKQPQAPGGSPSCRWCQYRDTSRRTGL